MDRSRFLQLLIPVAVLGLGITLTWLFFQQQNQLIKASAQARFEREVERETVAIDAIIRSHEDLLRGTQGLFEASVSVERAEWRQYLSAIAVEQRFTALDGLGFIAYVPKDQLAKYLETTRADGAPNYTIKPSGERDAYLVIKYLEPEARHAALIGTDIAVDANYREAALRARDTGQLAMSGKFNLTTGGSQQNAVWLLLPIYRANLPRNTIEERRAALVGWTYTPIRVADLFKSSIGSLSKEIDVEIFDGVRLSRETMLYSDRAPGLADSYQPAYSSRSSFDVGGRIWTLNFNTTTDFDSLSSLNPPYNILLGGIFSSLLLAGLIYGTLNIAALARAQADRMTASLRTSEERFRLISENAADLISIVDHQGQRLYHSPSYQKILGHSPSALQRTDAYAQIHPDDRALVAKATQDTIQTGVGHTLEYRMKSLHDDSWRTLESSASAVRGSSGNVEQIVLVARDISERKQSEVALQQQTSFLRTLYDTTFALMNRRAPTDILQLIVARAAELADTPHGYLFQLEPDGAEMEMKVGTGFFTQRVGDRIKPGQSVAGLTWQKGEPQIVDNYATWFGRVPHPVFDQLKTLAGVPLKIGTEVIGVLGLGHLETEHAFTEAEIERLAQFGQLAALALDNARLFSASQQSQAELERRVEQRTSELRESEENYRTTLESIEDGIYEVDLVGNLTFVNDATCRTFGMSKTQALGLNVLAYTTVDDVSRVTAAFNQVFHSGEPLRGLEFQIVRLDGARRFVETSVSLKRNESQQPIGFRGVARDVTERKQAANLLQGQARVLEAIAKDAPQDELLTQIIHFAEGHTHGAKCAITLVDADASHLRPGVGPSLPANFIQALDGIPTGPAAGSCGTAVFRKQQVISDDIANDPLWVDYRDWIINTHGLRACWSTPIITTQGQVLGTFAMYFEEVRKPEARDLNLITMTTQLASIVLERKQAEQALHTNEERFALALRGANDGLWDWNLLNNIVYYSPRWGGMLGYRADEIEANLSAFERLIHPEDKDRAFAHVNDYLTAQTDKFEIEFRMRHADGHYVDVLSRGFAAHDATGKPIRLVGTHVDISARKQSEENLRRQASYEAALGNIMLKLVSHRDVNSLLSEILARAGELVGAPHGYLYLLEPDDRYMQMHVGTGIQKEFVGNRIQRAEGLAGRVWDNAVPLVVNDYANWTGRLSLAGPKLQAVVGVPLTRSSYDDTALQVVGVLGLAHVEADKQFDQNTVAIIMRFAQLASVALDNARLLEQTQQRVAELAAITNINQVLNSQTDLRSLLISVTQTIRQYMEVSQCYIALYHPRLDMFEIPVANEGSNIHSVPLTPVQKGFTAEVIRTRQPLIINDNLAPKAEALGAPTFTDTSPSRCYMGVPIFVRDELVGIIAAQDVKREGVFDERALRLVTTLAPTLGVAIQNAQLFEQTQATLIRTQKQAEREQLLGAISDRLHKATDVQSVIRIAAEELQRATGSKRAVIRLGREAGNGQSKDDDKTHPQKMNPATNQETHKETNKAN